jgi:hypothetical protein
LLIEARVVVDSFSPAPQSCDFQRDYATTDDGMLDPKVLGKIVVARDMLLTSEE